MLGGYANTITTSCSVDNQIMGLKDKDNMNELVYHKHPTKEQLLEYFSQRIRVRKMTPREWARLQGFPDDYIFFGSRSEKNLQIGNAVPCNLAEAVAKATLKYMEKYE